MKQTREYLITGITGFVGSHLANLLAEEGHKVFGIVRSAESKNRIFKDIVPEKIQKAIIFLPGDLTDLRSLENIFKDHHFDGVFHFAAQSHAPTSQKDPYGTFLVNTQGTVNLATAIERYQPECRLVYASSAEVYGVSPEKKGAIREDFLLNPVTPYGSSKVAAELWLKERANSMKLPFIIGRGFTSVGPGKPRHFSISSDAAQIAEIKKGKKEAVINVGNLASRRGLMDVRDCVKAYYLLMQKGVPGEAYNIGSDDVRSIGEYLDHMLELAELKKKVEKRQDPSLLRSRDIPVQIPDISKIRKLTGWRPETPRERILGDLLNYWYSKAEAE